MMKRTSKLPDQADAIFCADWHLRDSIPVCRTDDFWEAQWGKVDFVADLQTVYNCPIFHSGDLFHHWKASPYLLSATLKHLPKNFHTVYGNHDLPQHSIELTERSGVHTLETAGALTILPGAHAGQEPTRDNAFDLCGYRTLVWHEGVWQGKAPWPGCTNPTTEEVLEKYDMFDLIVTGDFHIPCIDRDGDRLLVNPGSLMRQSADQIDFQPRIYLWSAEDNDVVPAFLPINPDAVSREHLDVMKERDKRIEAFISRLDVDWSTELSFEGNLKKYLSSNRVDARTEELIQKAVDLDL
ncbi:hypothetical protein LCGC14_2021830 [marine sediment metagenome]|uniref:Calcineurin-like phosphoesterase domain-containing protein n=1 Tax=marine sediment metagenome TaxID=412755 RepID=A0A0F9HUC2_9ZZZZ